MRLPTTSFQLMVVIFSLTTQSGLRSLSNKCHNNCLRCTPEGCAICFRRHFKTLSREPECSDREAPASEHCDMYVRAGRASKCIYCSSGFFLDQITNKCVKASIKDCIWGLKTSNQKIPKMCLMCKNGKYPSKNSRYCVNSTHIEGADANCEWGKRMRNVVQCGKCNEGFLAVSNSKRCVRKKELGCLILEGGKGQNRDLESSRCFLCNAWDGYFVLNDGSHRCVKLGMNCLFGASRVEDERILDRGDVIEEDKRSMVSS